MPDLMRIGGVSGWIKAANIAESKAKTIPTYILVSTNITYIH